MNKIKKIFIISSISLCYLIGISFADDWDCGIFAIWKYNNTSEANNSFENIDDVRKKDDYIYSKFLTPDQKAKIIDVDSLNTAILNLKKYCCEQSKGWLSPKSETCIVDKDFFNANSLDSPYLFEHLFDVIMRRLNGLTWENDIYTQTKMTVDEKGTERRNRINEKAENLSGSDVQSIINKYKEFRAYHQKYDINSEMNAQFKKDDSEFLKYVSGEWWGESEKIAKVFQEYENRSLYDRYHNACVLGEYFYALLAWKQSKDKMNTINILANWLCNDAVQKQISNENKYVWLVTQRAWNRYIYSYVQDYISYLGDRRNTLRDTQSKTKDKRLDDVKGVPHLVKSCVK